MAERSSCTPVRLRDSRDRPTKADDDPPALVSGRRDRGETRSRRGRRERVPASRRDQEKPTSPERSLPTPRYPPPVSRLVAVVPSLLREVKPDHKHLSRGRGPQLTGADRRRGRDRTVASGATATCPSVNRREAPDPGRPRDASEACADPVVLPEDGLKVLQIPAVLPSSTLSLGVVATHDTSAVTVKTSFGRSR